jgi:hypothetical protein
MFASNPLSIGFFAFFLVQLKRENNDPNAQVLSGGEVSGQA